MSGVVSLALLEAIVSREDRAKRFGGLIHAVAAVVEHVLSPTVPAIPDLRKHGGAAPASPAVANGSLVPPDWTTSPSTPTAPKPVII